MLVSTFAGIVAILICNATAAGSTISIHMTGEDDIHDVKAIIKDNSTFISIDDISEKLNLVSKGLGKSMIGICKDDICVPVRLDSEDEAIQDSGKLMINAELIASAIGSKAEWLISGKTLRFVPEDQVALDTVVKVGDVVPDFVLPSITDGKMVSLSSFRGKRVLLFMWASW